MVMKYMMISTNKKKHYEWIDRIYAYEFIRDLIMVHQHDPCTIHGMRTPERLKESENWRQNPRSFYYGFWSFHVMVYGP